MKRGANVDQTSTECLPTDERKRLDRADRVTRTASAWVVEIIAYVALGPLFPSLLSFHFSHTPLTRVYLFRSYCNSDLWSCLRLAAARASAKTKASLFEHLSLWR